MTKGQPKLTDLDLKSLLASDGDFLRTSMMSRCRRCWKRR